MISSQQAFLLMPIPGPRLVVLDVGAPTYMLTRSIKAMSIIRTNLRHMVGSLKACVASEYALSSCIAWSARVVVSRKEM
ncbi:hypothetical protein JMJ77_0008585 [Colletotrichum scovillei]|uniref:Uncharacterized protein n=1 Tax=Colletotrichum scovillei TaxID=1209932 RepID=A0A9P7RIH4_9PEZI|nr:hypothetical protein JMJ77_0008585 [Colletotrichum scovillei]KAG7075577.1 hypothetical protein JMJ76_0012037 [Colletotrichum scovillei]KAG7082625.1 hypothetical protein JMJ78_0004726 [Colletotrichum scovillei]